MKLFLSMRLFFIMLFCFTVKGVFSQAININQVKDAVTALSENFPVEKLYIQYDKPSYAPGETVWFKAYLLADNNTDNISKTLYIDFIDVTGRLLKHCVQPIYQSSASGDFNVPLDYKDQMVYVKAYTRWMLNFDSSFLYRKAIHVVQGKPSLKENKLVLKTSVQFLPEGGDLIEGIESKVAFKAISSDGRPSAIQGIVVDNNNEQAATLKTVHDGMGSFLLQPKTGEVYTAKWKDATGETFQTALPAAKTSGATVQIKLQKKTCGFVIQRSENASDVFKKLYIAATMQQHLVYFAGVNLSDNYMTGGSIPVIDLPSGTLQITLFDSNWMAIAERIVFINNDEYHFEPEAGFSELGLDKRKSNTLVISVPDTIIANLSVAVTDEGIGIDSSDNIISRLLLTGDLKGTVYHPAYYFNDNSDSLKQQLDLVMLTNGWRRINWQDVVHNKMPIIKYTNDTDYLKLSGKVFGTSETDIKQGAFVLMMLDNKKDSSHKIQQALLNPGGSFQQPSIALFDTTKAYYKIVGNSNVSDASAITFNTSMSALKIGSIDTTANILFADTATENYRRRLAAEQERFFKLQQGTTLQDVIVKTRVKSPMQLLDEKYTSALFKSDDAYQFNLINDPFSKSAPSIFTYLQGKVAGLNISIGGSGDASVSWRGGTPDFYLDENPVDLSTLSTINMTDVAYVKVFRPPFFGSVGGGSSGAIAIYTRKGGDVAQPKGKGLPYKILIGYTLQKDFYSPDYGTFDNKNYNDEDLRTTLYWNPMILTNQENHSIRIHFYNNDITKGFRLILEGISTDGRLAHIEKVVE